MSKVRVAVTQQHIDTYASHINDGCGCPIFHALDDAGLRPAWVRLDEIGFRGGPYLFLSHDHPAAVFQREGMSARTEALGGIGNDLASVDPDPVAAKVAEALRPFEFEVST